MEINEQLHRQIEGYLAGTLSEAENQAFAQRIENDEELAETVETYRLGNDLAMGQDLLDFQAEMQAFHADYQPSEKPSPKKGGNGTNYLLGFVGLLLVGALVYYFSDDSEKNTAETIQKIELEKEVAKPIQSIEKKNSANSELERSKIENSNETEKTTSEKAPVEIENQKIKSFYKLPTINSNGLETTTISVSEVEPSKVTIPDHSLDLSAAIIIEPACQGKRDGSIAIDAQQIPNGTPPYQLSVNLSDFKAGLVYKGLPAGTHEIYVKDAENRLQGMTVTVSEKVCEVERSYAFNPSRGEEFAFPLAENGSGKVEVFSASGAVIWQAEFSDGKNLKWNGRSVNGQIFPQGNYTFRVQYKNQKIESGGLTIVR